MTFFDFLTISANFGVLCLAKYGPYVSSDGRYGFIRCHRANLDNLKFFDFWSIFRARISVPIAHMASMIFLTIFGRLSGPEIWVIYIYMGNMGHISVRFFDHFRRTLGACISQDRGCISVPIANMAFSDVIEQIWAI